jgi:predicted neuraminidase
MRATKQVKEYIFADDRPFASCHASTLLSLPNGCILAAWFGGTREGAEDVAIWYAKRLDGQWSKRERIVYWEIVIE